MNAPILRLFVLVLVLLGTLVGFTSYWAVFDADELEQRAENRRSVVETAAIQRGSITSADGETIAESVRRGRGSRGVYVRRYPLGALFGHPVGYSFIELANSGIERSEDAVLIGEQNEFETLLDELQGTPQEGSSLTVTLDAEAQRVALDALAGRAGSVVAIEPATGAVRVMASVPGYDPNAVPGDFGSLSQDAASPLVNRATQSTYPPGSTMKVVTAAAALDSGELTPGSVLDASSPVEIGGVPLENFGGQSFGSISMTAALTNSVNTYWAQVGERLGSATMLSYMERFGFDADPKLDYPPGQMAPSGVYEAGKLLDASDPIDIGRVAIGQERLLVTPLQMAQVAATVANGGVLMKPTFVQAVTDPDGRTTAKLDPGEQGRAIGAEAAAELAAMMRAVTEEGTAAGLSVGGVPFAGKTGTAEIDPATRLNQPWFVGFAPAEEPRVAVAATVEPCTGCFGGEVAGPIATRVMESLIE